MRGVYFGPVVTGPTVPCQARGREEERSSKEHGRIGRRGHTKGAEPLEVLSTSHKSSHELADASKEHADAEDGSASDASERTGESLSEGEA